MAVHSDSSYGDILGRLAEKGKEGGKFPIYYLLINDWPNAQTTTSTSFGYVADAGAPICWAGLPELKGITTLYARHVARIKNDTSGETTTARIMNFQDDEEIDTDLRISVTADGEPDFVDSGWVNVDGYSPTTDPFRILPSFRVTGGTGTYAAGAVYFAREIG